MRSVRLILAKASSVTGPGMGSRSRRARRHAALEVVLGAFAGFKAEIELRAEDFLALRFRLHGKRMAPLEAPLDLASDLPERVAEMLVDRRIAGLQLRRAFEIFDGEVVFTEPVARPAETVHDEAVIRAALHRFLDHGECLVEIAMLFYPGITEIVQNQRVLIRHGEGEQEVSLRLVP